MTDWSRLHIVTPPTAGVITLPQAKSHLRITYADEDAYIQQAIDASRATIEGPNGAGICLTPQTWRLSLDGFPGPLFQHDRAYRVERNAVSQIRVPLGPVTAINSITYIGSDGNPATVASWRTDFDSEPCCIWPARGMAWPAVIYEPGAVKVEFVAGYATPPADLGWAMLLLVSHFYEHREAVVGVLERATPIQLPMGVEAILNRYRAGTFA